jgi:hypothetical protein
VNKIVIRGLDPRIPSIFARNKLAREMGGRVKPGHDIDDVCLRVAHSGRVRFRLLRLARLRADRLSRGCRLDAHRPPRRNRRDVGLGSGSEIDPAAGTELRFVPDHADRDAVDIRNLRAAKAKSIVAARLLLLGGVGLACARQHRNRKPRCQHQTELEIPRPDSKH